MKKNTVLHVGIMLLGLSSLVANPTLGKPARSVADFKPVPVRRGEQQAIDWGMSKRPAEMPAYKLKEIDTNPEARPWSEQEVSRLPEPEKPVLEELSTDIADAPNLGRAVEVVAYRPPEVAEQKEVAPVFSPQAVTALQARVRGNLARKEVGLLRRERLMKQEVAAALQEPAGPGRQERISEVGDKWATKIRSDFMATKSPALRQRLIKMSKDLAQPIQQDAAVVSIQSAVRRKQAQKQVAELRQQRKQLAEARDSQINLIKEKIANELQIAISSSRIQAMPRPKIGGIIDLALGRLPKMATRVERQEQLYKVETELREYITKAMAEAKTKPQRDLLIEVSGLIAQKIDQFVALK